MIRPALALAVLLACAPSRALYGHDEGFSLGQIQPRAPTPVSPDETPQAPRASGAPVAPKTASVADLPVDAPAELGRIPGLNAGEVRFMLQWEGGRYSPAGPDRLKDSLDPGERVLTYREVFGLLGTRGSLIADIFRRLSERGSLPEDALEEARHQYFNRGTLLPENDRSFFRALTGIDWDDVYARIANVLGGGGGEAAGPPAVLAYGIASSVASRASVPEVRLRPAAEAPLVRIRIERREGEERAFRLLSRAVAAMLGTPTGRRLGERLAREGPDVLVGFDALAPRLRGTTRPGPEGMIVRLNSDWLKSRLGEKALVQELAAELAHHVLGHALERHAAAREGLFRAYSLWRGDEENAARASGLVGGELRRGAHPRRCGYDEGPFKSLVLTQGELARAEEVYAERLRRAGDPGARRILEATMRAVSADMTAAAELRRASRHPLFKAAADPPAGKLGMMPRDAESDDGLERGLPLLQDGRAR